MIPSWCDACAELDGCAGHFQCRRPNVPFGYKLTGSKELTPNGWNEEIQIQMSEANAAAIAEQYNKFLYVKDLPDPLRSMRIATLRMRLAEIRRNGYPFALVLQNREGTLDVIAYRAYPSEMMTDPAFREIYDLSKDLESMLRQERAK